MAKKTVKNTQKARSRAAHGSGARGDFYRGIEWLACWMLDHVEGEIVTEELLREWATKAWREGKKRQNDGAMP